MYKYRKRKNIFLKIIGLIILMFCISFFSIFVYDIYLNTNIYSIRDNEYIVASNSKSYNNKNEEKNASEIELESIKYIVGISKIKNLINCDNEFSEKISRLAASVANAKYN